MGVNRRVFLYFGGVTLGLIVVAFLVKMSVDAKTTAQIPDLSDTQTISEPVLIQISEALENVSRHTSAENLGKLGMVYHSSANYKEAGKCYELAIKKSKTDWVWNYYQGYLSMEMGESEAVIENLSAVIRKNPDLTMALYYLGEEYKNKRDYKSAEESFGSILTQKITTPLPGEATRVDHFPISTYARFQLARIYFETDRIELTEKTLREIIESDPTFGPAYRLLGNVFSMNGEDQLSERYGVRANDLVAYAPPVDTMVDRLILLSRSELYLPKKIDEAERSIYSAWALRLLNNAMQYFPENKYLISKAIRIYLWVELDQKAIALMDQHIDFFKDGFTEMSNKGNLFYQNGLYPQSIIYFNAALKIEPEDVEIRKKLAICYWYVGAKQKSQDLLDQLVEEHRGNSEVLADVADILFFNLKDEGKASRYLSRLKTMAPTHPKLYKVSAGIAEEKGDFSKAIQLYDSSFRGDPEDLTTIKFLGNLLMDQNMWTRSLEHYSKALDFHPNDSYLLERYGTLLVGCPDSTLRNIGEGIEYLERAFIHKSSRPNTLVYTGRSLSFAYAKNGESRKAVSTIQQTIVIARRAKFSSAFIAELENMSAQFQL